MEFLKSIYKLCLFLLGDSKAYNNVWNAKALFPENKSHKGLNWTDHNYFKHASQWLGRSLWSGMKKLNIKSLRYQENITTLKRAVAARIEQRGITHVFLSCGVFKKKELNRMPTFLGLFQESVVCKSFHSTKCHGPPTSFFLKVWDRVRDLKLTTLALTWVNLE